MKYVPVHHDEIFACFFMPLTTITLSGLPPEKMASASSLFNFLRTLAGQHSLMVVEHDMGFVETIADRVTVLHQGQVLAEGSLREVQANEQVIEVYLGR